MKTNINIQLVVPKQFSFQSLLKIMFFKYVIQVNFAVLIVIKISITSYLVTVD